MASVGSNVELFLNASLMDQLIPAAGSVTPREVAVSARIRSQFESGWSLGPEFDVSLTSKHNGSSAGAPTSSATAAESNSHPVRFKVLQICLRQYEYPGVLILHRVASSDLHYQPFGDC
jgi:hypothetical protein